MPTLRRLAGEGHSPLWNAHCGDRLTGEDLPFIREFEHSLYCQREEYDPFTPPFLRAWLDNLRNCGEWYRLRITKPGLPLTEIPVSSRRDLAENLEDIIPVQADLKGLVLNPSSGTTGEPLLNPNHPRAVACYDPLIQFALKRHGMDINYRSGDVAAVQLCYQQQTITYYTVHSYLQGAGFAKINLHPDQWPGKSSPQGYLDTVRPRFLSGDPLAFSRAVDMGIRYRPPAILSTALALPSDLRQKLEKHFHCPVVDMYSLNETGPLAYSCPQHPDRWHILPTDVAVEIVDPDGHRLPQGESGLIAVTGGRNPYIPLLRYLTGDRAVLHQESCSCGDPMPWLAELQGRDLVLFRDSQGASLNTIDISRILQRYPVLQYQCRQSVDGTVSLDIEWHREPGLESKKKMREDLALLLGEKIALNIDYLTFPAGKKILSFMVEN